jgi:hypothetical protein
MRRVQALVTLSLLIAPAIAHACPSMAAAADGCGSCGAGSMMAYVIAFGGGLVAGIGSIALRRRDG